jgi:membrane-bound serine protease (ClpP class)
VTRRRRLALAVAALVPALPLALAVAQPPQPPAAPAPSEVVTVRIASIIHPVAAEFLVDALREADAGGAAAFVVQLDTPGGLLTSTREMFTAMLGARTPVVVYVAPSGAQAASAGFFLLMAADVAAMAPGTNAGAAHPVGGGGEKIEGVMAEKIEQDAAASIRSLAARNGRNAELAEAAVLKSRSFTADEALAEKLIDLTAPDLAALLAAIDGREVKKVDGRTLRLATKGAPVREIAMGPFKRLLAALAHPNIAYLLLTLGGLGLYFELAHPGAVLPGVVGGICLLLAFFGLSVLPVNYAGVALVLLGLVFFIAEIKVPSYGLLTIGGVVAIVLGGLMLFKTAEPALRVSIGVLAGLGAAALAIATLVTFLVLRVHRLQVRTGVEGLVHAHGQARGALQPRGKVFVQGEIWNAVAEEPVAAGAPVEVVAVDGMTLVVRPLQAATEGGSA